MSRFLKKTLKVTGIAFLVFLGFIILYLLAGAGLSCITVPAEAGAKPEIAIYIKTNGVHTDLVVPVHNEQMDWSREVKFAHTLSADTACTYLGMGWGDKGFYLQTPAWAELKASVALKAAFGMSTTAIHTTYYHGLRENASCKKIMLSKAQYTRLVAYIINSFQTDAAGHVIPVPTSVHYGGTDAFYEARGVYHLFKTCNTWANSGLRACGQKCCLWTAFDTGIFAKYP